MTTLCNFLLFAYTASCLAQTRPVSSGSSGASNIEPVCFDPPDHEHHVSRVIDVCAGLFTDFIGGFGPQGNATLLWTGDNAKWKDPNTVHLPKVQFKLNDNETEACLMEITDQTRTGDVYAPNNVVLAGNSIIEACLKQDLCGELPLGPNYTTSLAVCGTVHKPPPGLQGSCNLAADQTGSGCLQRSNGVSPIDQSQTAT